METKKSNAPAAVEKASTSKTTKKSSLTATARETALKMREKLEAELARIRMAKSSYVRW